ncbi:MAG TPA: GNAT family N-acetyltransferase [Thermoplasmata archaeon]|nr:GNAT family N-acetyltransferase [Thermoplasmata archaeon]
MILRDLRKSDGPRLYDLLKIGFPEEEALMGSTPEGLAKVTKRVYRWDVQFVLRLARLFGRPIFRFFVIEDGGQIVATTILGFPERAAYISTVMVDSAYRRRGYAQALLEKCRTTARAARRKYLVLNVLRPNAPAIALYERLGYRRLADGGAFLAREATVPVTGGRSEAVRPYRKADARGLAEIARRATPPEVLEVLPVNPSSIRVSGWVDRALESSSSGWVVDRGHGAEAFLSASVGGISTAAHCSEPIIGEGVGPDEVAALVRTAVEWCSARGAPRILARAAFANTRGRAALTGGGFREALTDWTLYREVD